LQIALYGLDHLFVVVKKIGDGLQKWLQQNALLQQLPLGETDLRLRSSRHGSVLRFFRGLVPFPFQMSRGMKAPAHKPLGNQITDPE